MSFNPYQDNSTELHKQYCPIKGYLSVDYVQLVTYNLLCDTELGRPYVKYELGLFAIYSFVMEKRDTVVTFQFSPISYKITGHASSELEENLKDHVTKRILSGIWTDWLSCSLTVL